MLFRSRIVSTYGERDGQRVVLLRSDDGGDTWSPDVSAGSTPAMASNQQRVDIGSTAIYVGTAERGVATDNPAWTVKRIELTSNNPTSIQWATNVAWDDRTFEEYS